MTETQLKEIMGILQEECAEVIQAVSKVNRFGLDNTKPGTEYSNREHLEEELGDLVAMINILCDTNIVSDQRIKQAAKAKLQKLKQWSTIYEVTSGWED
jgi:NTP pyrophosphatase (non-canonical NTP hydrolase)